MQEKTEIENGHFLDKNDGLTPLKNFNIFTSLKLHSYCLENILFYPEYQKNVFFRLIIHQKRNNEKCLFFHNSHGLTPL